MLVYLKRKTTSPAGKAAGIATTEEAGGPTERYYEGDEMEMIDGDAATAGGSTEAENITTGENLVVIRRAQSVGGAGQGSINTTQRHYVEGEDEIIYDDSSDDEKDDHVEENHAFVRSALDSVKGLEAEDVDDAEQGMDPYVHCGPNWCFTAPHPIMKTRTLQWSEAISKI